MGKENILTERQQEILAALGRMPSIRKHFYLSGGTALAAYYLQHRFSEDLDFFSEEEVDTPAVFTALRSLPKSIGIKNIDLEQSFNRNLFFLHLKGEVIKTEFTYYPFPRIETGLTKSGVSVDSLIDIATNKLFTIYQKPRARDFIDLYLILKKKDFSLAELIKKAKVKFDWHVDPLQLGAQFHLATEVKDYPRMIEKIDQNEWQKYFLDEAKKLEKQIAR